MQPKNLIFENRNYQSDVSFVVDWLKTVSRKLPATGIELAGGT